MPQHKYKVWAAPTIRLVSAAEAKPNSLRAWDLSLVLILERLKLGLPVGSGDWVAREASQRGLFVIGAMQQLLNVRMRLRSL